MSIRKDTLVGNYLEVDGVYEFLRGSFSELTESPAAQTSSKRYVGDSSATKRISNYDWSTPYNTDQIRSKKAVEYICSIGELQKTGADAETKYVIVDLDKPAKAENSFRARLINVAIEVASFDNNDGELAVSGNFLGQGDPVLGTFNTQTKTFTENFEPKDTMKMQSKEVKKNG
ncbi:hypothetical protein QJR26_12225 [Clostridium baratii]